MKRIIPILKLLMLCFLGQAVYAQENGASKKIIDQLSCFETNNPIEKAYLQLDKPYYAAGDTIYFKAYVTAGEHHKLSGISGVLHVDLVNTKNKIDQSIKLQLDSGLASGDFALPDSLPAGNYRVRAYTQWMRNFNETGFFEKTIAIGSSTPQKIPESGSKQVIANGKPDVQFFPEGGSLIAGITSKVAFKAVGPNGSGTEISGTIVDREGHEVAKFESAHLGMGCFQITAIPGESYSAKIDYGDGRQDMIGLPKPEAGGIVLLLNNDSIPQAMIQISASADYYRLNKGKVYTLVITSLGSATSLNCKLDSPVIKLEILKRKLHTGVATVTLFSPENEPLCERLLFIQNYDQLNLDVNTDKSSYAKRDLVTLKLNAFNRKGDPSAGHFSVSVTDETKVGETNKGDDNILTHLLLTSDLKGFIEQPNYYFEDTSITARKNLDILMLTQGYRRFEWKLVLNNSYPPLAYQPEKGVEISGMIKNLNGKPINNGTVTLLPSKGGPILTSVSDDKGMFHFRDLVFADTTHFVLSAINAKGKNSTNITYFKDDPEPVSAIQLQNIQSASDTAITALVENEKLQQQQLTKYGPAKGVMLKEVKVKAKGEIKYPTGGYVPEFAADQVIHGKDILYGGPLSVRLAGMIHRAHYVPGGFVWNVDGINGPLMYVMVDGAPGSLDDVGTEDVATIEVLLPPNSYVYGSIGLDGMIIIATKRRGADAKDMPSFGVLPVSPRGFYKAREFYSPKYNPGAIAGQQPDFRSTIYWHPEIKTDAKGNASLYFYNADGTGTYKVTVEGIDKDGNIGRQVFRYEVK